MVFDIDKVGLLPKAEYSSKVVAANSAYGREGTSTEIYSRGEKAFLVVHLGTDPLRVEVRTDGRLRKLLMEKYESVLDSRYFGRNGVEVICSGQLTEDEVYDLIRLSYFCS